MLDRKGLLSATMITKPLGSALRVAALVCLTGTATCRCSSETGPDRSGPADASKDVHPTPATGGAGTGGVGGGTGGAITGGGGGAQGGGTGTGGTIEDMGTAGERPPSPAGGLRRCV